MSSATLLVVHHSPTRGTRALLDAVLEGAGDDAIDGVDVRVLPALEASADDVLAADGYVLATPANFGYMSGALKHFFDSTFLDIGGALSPDGGAGSPAGPPDGGAATSSDGSPAARSGGSTAGRPFGLVVHGRYDTAGAVRSVLSIVQALRWRQSCDVLEVLGDVGPEHREAAYELGGTIAALLSPP